MQKTDNLKRHTERYKRNHRQMKEIEKNENKISGFIDEVKRIIENGLNMAYDTTSKVMIITYWNVGKQIVSQEQNGKQRAEYGKQIIALLSEELTKTYGEGYTDRNLRNYRAFYLKFSDLEI